MDRLVVQKRRLLVLLPTALRVSCVCACAGVQGFVSGAWIALDGAALYSPFVGDAEATLRAAFRQARQSVPALIFLDEVECAIVCCAVEVMLQRAG
jgi:hypothetical protein